MVSNGYRMSRELEICKISTIVIIYEYRMSNLGKKRSVIMRVLAIDWSVYVLLVLKEKKTTLLE